MGFGKKLLFSGLTILPCSLLLAQENEKEYNCPFAFHACYTGDVVSNFSGGLKRGTTYLGLANLKATFDTQKAGWWSKGTFFLNFANTHGGKPSEEFVGDFQGISNIEAGDLTFLYELWYQQQLGRVTIRAGLQDLNADFALSEYGVIFANSSFGIHSSIADNIASPIFPLTALGLNVDWEMSDSFHWKSAIFDGTPDDFRKNPYNVHWKLSAEQGYLAVSELELHKSLLAGRNGCYKLGAYFHEHTDSTSHAEDRNGGVYLVADQQITDEISVFSQIGLSPVKNTNNAYYSLGMTCKGIFPKRKDDEMGVALAYSKIHDTSVGSELVLEMAYQLKINSYMYVKPDLQYVINPAGTDDKLENALVGFVRFGVQF